jgi:WD40 repeat protein/serine/threonine protein kinase
MDSSSPRTIKGYDLLEQLGEGAYGAIYRAHQPLIDREVAVKIILPQYANQPEFIRRFESEAQLVAQLEHLHIVPLYDYWRDPDGAYLVMRLMRGGSLAEALDGNGPWEPESAAMLVDQLASALEAAHQKGVVHRDLKPANILLDGQGNAYLSDFGIAKELGAEVETTQTGAILGTPAYITPEQVQSLPVTPQTDIYALGILLYQLLVGEHPFPDSSNAELVVKHLQEALPYVRDTNPELPAALDGVIQRATAKDPADRYLDAVSLAADFRHALQLEGELPKVPEEEIYNPYKGLRAFQVSDADDFFGRETLTGQLLAHLASPGSAGHFLAVVGPSGSGKSSVVKAGLLPALSKGALPGSEQWFMVEMHPGPQPVNELALALLSISADPDLDLTEILNQDRDGLSKAVKSALPSGESELLLVIDQFEELFSLVDDEEKRSRFLELLHTAVTDEDSQVRVVLTLRADFYDWPLMHPDFGRLVEGHTVVVLPLTPEELGEAIQRPAERAGAVLEKELVSTISEDVIDQPGALPLLQYALTELFEHREGRMLTNQAYRDVGGVLGALGRRAEEVYAGLDPAGKDAARQLFLRLVTLGEGAEDTRRRVLRQELDSLSVETHHPPNGDRAASLQQPVEIFLESFGRARLLSFDHDPATRSPTVEVAHEALLRMQVVLSNATADWLAGGKESSYLLRGSRLAQFEVWSEETSLAMTDAEGRFLEASLAFEAERKAQQAALERRSRNFLRALVVVFAVAALVAIGLSLFAFNQQSIAQDNAATAVAEADARATQQIIAENEAEARATQQAIAEAETDARATQQTIAEEQKAIVEEQALAAQRQADINQSRFLAGQSQLALQGNIRDLALELGVAAIQIDDPPGEAELALSEAAYSPGVISNFAGDHGEIPAVWLSTDGSTLLSYSIDITIRQWDVNSGMQIKQTDLPELDIPEGPFWAAAFSPDGSRLLLGLNDFSLVLLDVETGEIVQRMEGHTSPVISVAFSPDGQRAISGSGPLDFDTDAPPGSDLSMRLWDLTTGQEIRRFEGPTHSITELTFTPNGRAAVAGSWDGSLILWDLETGEILHRMIYDPGSEEAINLDDVDFVAITPDGSRALANYGEGNINLWDLETGQLIRNWSGFFQQPSKLSISPDGRLAAFGHMSGEINVVDIETGEALLHLIGDNIINQLVFNIDSEQFFSTSGNMLRLWSLKSGGEIRRFDHEMVTRDIAYSPDGRTAISLELTGALNLWDLETGQALRRIELPDWCWSVVYTLDSASALVTLWNGEVIQYDLSSGEEIQRLDGKDEADGLLNDVVAAIAISPDGKTVLTGSQNNDDQDQVGTLILWDLESEEKPLVFETVEAIFAVDLSPDGKTAISGGEDSIMILWDLRTGEAIREFEGHEGIVWAVAYNPDGKTALSASWDNTLILWNLETGEIVHRLLGHQDIVRAVVFHPDGRTAISGSRDNTLILWDLETGKAIRRYRGHTGQINDLSFGHDGKTVLSSSVDGSMIEWRIDDTLEELVAWTEANRHLQELTCSERAQFNIQPLCEE